MEEEHSFAQYITLQVWARKCSPRCHIGYRRLCCFHRCTARSISVTWVGTERTVRRRTTGKTLLAWPLYGSHYVVGDAVGLAKTGYTARDGQEMQRVVEMDESCVLSRLYTHEQQYNAVANVLDCSSHIMVLGSSPQHLNSSCRCVYATRPSTGKAATIETLVSRPYNYVRVVRTTGIVGEHWNDIGTSTEINSWVSYTVITITQPGI